MKHQIEDYTQEQLEALAQQEDPPKAVFFSEDITEEQKKWMQYMINDSHRKRNSLYVVYETKCKGCGLEYESDVLLDRWPMSEKIISSCPECKKGVLNEISDPIVFMLKGHKLCFDHVMKIAHLLRDQIFHG